MGRDLRLAGSADGELHFSPPLLVFPSTGAVDHHYDTVLADGNNSGAKTNTLVPRVEVARCTAAPPDNVCLSLPLLWIRCLLDPALSGTLSLGGWGSKLLGVPAGSTAKLDDTNRASQVCKYTVSVSSCVSITPQIAPKLRSTIKNCY